MRRIMVAGEREQSRGKHREHGRAILSQERQKLIGAVRPCDNDAGAGAQCAERHVKRPDVRER